MDNLTEQRTFAANTLDNLARSLDRRINAHREGHPHTADLLQTWADALRTGAANLRDANNPDPRWPRVPPTTGDGPLLHETDPIPHNAPSYTRHIEGN